MSAVVPSRMQIEAIARAYSLGASFAESFNVSNAAIQLINPASNINGLILWCAGLCTLNPPYSTLFADTAAPASPTDATKRAILVCTAGAVQLSTPRYIPPGVGVWAIASAAGSYAFVNYDLL